MSPDDGSLFHKNDEDTESARLSYWIPFPRSAAGTMRWVESAAAEQPDHDRYRMVIENLQGEVVGTINTFECDARSGTFKYGIGIFRPYWRRGYASEAIRIVLRYFFDELRYQKVTVHIYDFNDGSLQLHARLGFQLEGRLRRMIYTDGAYHDEIILGLTAEEFRALS
jgi:RimJ/RimL family protein N-acetyltransferase